MQCSLLKVMQGASHWDDNSVHLRPGLPQIQRGLDRLEGWTDQGQMHGPAPRKEEALAPI